MTALKRKVAQASSLHFKAGWKPALLLVILALAGCISHRGEGPRAAGATARVELTRAELARKIKGGWAGQIIGVSVAAPTEFLAKQVLWDKPLRWNEPQSVNNAIRQDDLYVEMTFADVMDRIGLDAQPADYGKAFGESKYGLWHANKAGRDNIRAGIMPPASGDPAHNAHWRDIDFQIEADFIGLMCPAMPQTCNRFCERVGHVMNYGDGVYGGMVLAAMYSAAFTESDPEKIVRAGVAVVPPESDTAKSFNDLLRLYHENPTDWKKTWAEYNKLWDEHDEPCPDGKGRAFNIDAFLNGCYVAIGLLYGEGDFVKTVEIATRCGQDSDCNGASAGGIIGTVLGYDKLPQPWRAELEKIGDEKFQYTNYSFHTICDSTMRRAEANIAAGGGRIRGERVLIAAQAPKPPAMEVWTGEFKKETPQPERYKIDAATITSKIRGGWAGQMIGVAVGGPTEFKARQTLYTEPLAWDHTELIKLTLNQDDLYVEMTFAEVMDKIGLKATMADYGKAFGASQYNLWHANKSGRDNIRAGIMPPQSGDPAHNPHWRDIDFQIEADFIGLMCPGLPVTSNRYCDTIGHVMNYGDGVYGGMFLAAMYAAAFMERDPERIVRAGLAVLPPDSLTAQSARDLLRIYRENPTDYKKAWADYNKLWDEHGEPCPAGAGKPYNIDAFLNGAYVAIGLLYGGGDFKKTTEIAIACGQDSDCNGASAAGILGTVLGYEALPADWRAALEGIKDQKFNFTNYSFESICESTLKRAQKNVLEAGGQVGPDVWRITRQDPVPAEMEVWKGPVMKEDAKPAAKAGAKKAAPKAAAKKGSAKKKM